MARRRAGWGEADLAVLARRNTTPGPSLHLPGGILALDLSGVVGWAYGGPDDDYPLTGTWLLPKAGGIGARYAAYENALIDALALHRPHRVVVEAPMRLYAQTAKRGSESAARQQYGLHAYTEGECWRSRIPVDEADVMPVRDAVMGTRWRRRAEGITAKDAVVQWCADRGWSVPDHNAADACILWQFHCDRARAKPAKRTPTHV